MPAFLKYLSSELFLHTHAEKAAVNKYDCNENEYRTHVFGSTAESITDGNFHGKESEQCGEFDNRVESDR